MPFIEHQLSSLVMPFVCKSLTESLKAFLGSKFSILPLVIGSRELSQTVILGLQKLDQRSLLVLQRVHLLLEMLIFGCLLTVELGQFLAL